MQSALAILQAGELSPKKVDSTHGKDPNGRKAFLASSGLSYLFTAAIPNDFTNCDQPCKPIGLDWNEIDHEWDEFRKNGSSQLRSRYGGVLFRINAPEYLSNREPLCFSSIGTNKYFLEHSHMIAAASEPIPGV